ncbi:MAG: L-arabinose isomerase, partial [Deltaproteobacteria bacterium]|nr:L-arabinose isomerase [Deltaproteobacteria bacterium]
MRFWFIVGSQLMYGERTIKEVEANAAEMAKFLATKLPCPLDYKGVVLSNEGAVKLVKEANFAEDCAGIVTFCHTFSPSKMWINALGLLQKPWCHLHTQYNLEIPDDIDMDYMNLHQSAHGDREHGYIGARMGRSRKIIAGHWKDETVVTRLGKWQKACVGALFSQSLKVSRFGDNMREVAVTDGDKVGAQMKFGWQVNYVPVGALVEAMASTGQGAVSAKIEEYRQKYDFKPEDLEVIAYQAKEELAIQALLDADQCLAFTNTFQDLYGLKQLPGLATQNLMSKGYGYGAEGDWKTAALTAIVKKMAVDSSFMEDYTYDLKNGLSLGAHMLEVCPSIAAQRPKIEVRALSIGDREPPARLIFEGKAGKALVLTLLDLGGRFRLITQDIICVAPTQKMPQLPVARVMWKALPNLAVGAECWIMAGG